MFCLKQALKQLQKIPPDVEREYNRYKKDPHSVPPNPEIYQNLLKCCLQEFSKLTSNPVFILLDAYDEFVNTRGDEREQKELRSCMLDLSRTSAERVLITTRPQHLAKLKETIVESRVTETLGDINDVQRYLEERMKDVEISNLMKDKIKSTILDENKKEAW